MALALADRVAGPALAERLDGPQRARAAQPPQAEEQEFPQILVTEALNG